MCFQSFVSFRLKNHIKDCVFSMFFMFSAWKSYKRLCVFNVFGISTQSARNRCISLSFSVELGWHPKNIENTQSFIWFFNQKHKKHWKHTVFYMIFHSQIWKRLKTHSLLYVFSIENIKMIENTYYFYWFSKPIMNKY